MIYKDIGKKIQKARGELGLSQEGLAFQLGYTQAALSNYELGKRRLYLANIEQIARELNKPLSYFLDESATMTANAEEGKQQDETISEIIKLLSELPAEERKYLLEYIKWRRDRLR
jgi:transcriptional regulator with XRE-family HTH domain